MSRPPELTLEQARLLIVVRAFVARNGVPPTWAELRSMLGVDRRELEQLLFGLRRGGLVGFRFGIPGERSTRVTASPSTIAKALRLVQDEAARQREERLKRKPAATVPAGTEEDE